MPIRITLKRGNKRKVITCANPKRRNPGRLIYWYKMKTGGHWFSLVARPGETPAERLSRAIYTDASAIGAMPAGMSLGTWRNMASNAVYYPKHTVPVLKKSNPKRKSESVSDLYIMGIGEGRTLLRALKKEGEYNAARDIPKIIENIKKAMQGASAQVKEVNKGELAFWKHQQNLKGAGRKKRKTKSRPSAHEAFNVYIGRKFIDTVFASKGAYTAAEMKTSLVNHDGYDSRITVTKARK